MYSASASLVKARSAGIPQADASKRRSRNMAVSICGRCENKTFELVTKEPKGSAIKINFIQCAACGSVLGMVDFFNVGTEVMRISKVVGDLDRRTQNMEAQIHQIGRALAR
jgi:hypothetical protein